MTVKIIVDSNIIIDALRRFAPAAEFIKTNIDNLAISVLTFVEVRAGNRNRAEEKEAVFLMERMRKFEVDEEISILAGKFASKFLPSHGTGLADSIIAATAEINQSPLATLNKKHYPMVRNLIVPYKKL